MTNPIFDIAEVIPLKYKAIVGTVGAVLSFAVPYIVEVQNILPSPWPVIIGIVFAILSGLGIIQAPYKPTGSVLVPQEVAHAGAGAIAAATSPAKNIGPTNVLPSPQPGEYRNPWG